MLMRTAEQGVHEGVSELHVQLWKQMQGAGRQRLESLGSVEGELFSKRHADN